MNSAIPQEPRPVTDDAPAPSANARRKLVTGARRSVWLGIVLLLGCARQEPKPNVLVIVVDTLRADRVGASGERETTPRLNEFAEDALWFTHLQSPRAKTTPAVASLMTGLYPHDNGPL